MTQPPATGVVFAGWPVRHRMALAFVLGAGAALGLEPYRLWLATLIALAVLPALFLAANGWRAAAWTGWAFATGYFFHALIWIVEPFLVDPVRHGWMAPFAVVFMAGGLALFWGAAFGGAFVLGRSPGTRIAALAVTLGLFEFARAYVLTGFPWAALAQIWVSAPPAQTLALIGPHGLAFLTTLVAFAPVALLYHRRTILRGGLAVVPALALLALSVAMRPGEVSLTGATVRLVQPNATQELKWNPDYAPVFFDRQVAFSAAEPRPDLIVWPEVAIPTLLNHAGEALAVVAQAAQGTPVALGILRRDGQRQYNSLALMDGQGQLAAIYDKHHLVPFGEYIPLSGLASRLGIRGFAAQGNVVPGAGPGPELMDFGALGTALPLICYEAVFPQDVSGAPGRPAFLLQVTNDAWFGAHSGPYQHLAQARMRAIEQGLPMVRVANTGVSAMIDPYGRITQSVPLGVAGYVDAGLPEANDPTVYAGTGDWPVFGLLCLLLLGLWGYRRMPNRSFGD